MLLLLHFYTCIKNIFWLTVYILNKMDKTIIEAMRIFYFLHQIIDAIYLIRLISFWYHFIWSMWYLIWMMVIYRKRLANFWPVVLSSVLIFIGKKKRNSFRIFNGTNWFVTLNFKWDKWKIDLFQIDNIFHWILDWNTFPWCLTFSCRWFIYALMD